MDISLGERCLVKGKITANKAPGGFHVAGGRNVRGSQGHEYDMVFQLPDLSFRHKIQRLRFGEKILTASVPLEDIVKDEKVMGPTMYRYNLILTPVMLYQNRTLKAKGFEYTALQTTWTGLIGLFFWYTFKPYKVVVHVKTNNIAQAVTSLAGFLAGIWAIMSLIDRCLTGCRKSE
jgi:hypothetical protein